MTAMALLLAALVGAAETAVGGDEAVRLTAEPSKSTVTVGEPFTVTVQAVAPAGTSWDFPVEVAADGLLLKVVETSGEAGAVYQATVFTLDQATIPSISASYKLPDGSAGKVSSEPVVITVASLLPDDPAQQRLADLRPPVPLPAAPIFWLVLGLLLVGLAGGVAWWWGRRRLRAPGDALPPPPLEVPPAEEARAALQRLHEAGLVERGELRDFYIELAVIAKRYLERRLAAPVLEMTSAETAAFLRDHPVARRLAAAVRDVTLAADDVKFARGQADEARAHRHWRQVQELVEELERLLAAPSSSQPLERTA